MTTIFGKKSLDKLATCDVRLQTLIMESAKDIPFDFTILCGHRNKEDQDAAFAAGKSKLKWPDSKHNFNPSKAVDIAPIPIDWNDIDKFRQLRDHVMNVAEKLDIKIRNGSEFSFKDWPHYELI